MIADIILEYLSLRLPFGGGKAHHKALKDALSQDGIKTVLDVGCGRGVYTIYRQFESTGIDIFKADLKAARRHGNYKRLIRIDARRLPFPDKSFDVVTCNEVIEHLTKQEGIFLISKLEKIARKRVVIMTPWGFDDLPKRKDNPYLDHQCGWVPGEFEERGYKTHPFISIRWRRGNKPYQIIFSYLLTILCQPLIKLWPSRLSNDFWAVKDL